MTITSSRGERKGKWREFIHSPVAWPFFFLYEQLNQSRSEESQPLFSQQGAARKLQLHIGSLQKPRGLQIFMLNHAQNFIVLEQVVCQNPKRFVVKAKWERRMVPASLWACCKELLCFYGFVCFGSKYRNQTGASSCHYTGAWVSFLFGFSQPFQLCNKIVLKCILVLNTLFF